MSEDLVVNGRFTHLEPGGFRRYAQEVAERLPAAVIEPPASFGRGVRGRLWEGLRLPRAVGDRTLINLTGSATARRTRQLTVLHDILPLELPELYSGRYVRWFGRQLEHVVGSSNALVVPSAEVREDVLKRFPDRDLRITVAPPGLADSIHDPLQQSALDATLGRLGIDPTQPLVVGMNSSVPRKNGQAVLQALEGVRAQRPDVALVTIGHDGPSRVFGDANRPVHASIADLGTVDDKTVDALFRRADVVMTLPHGEGFGMVPIEAAARGARIVSTHVPSLAHLSIGCHTVSSWSEAAEAAVELVDHDPVDYSHLFDRLHWNNTANHVLAAARSLDEPHTSIDLRNPPASTPTTAPAAAHEGNIDKWQE